MKKLNVYVGSDLNSLVPYQVGFPIQISNDLFHGDLTIFLADPRQPLPHNHPSKKFSIQVTGNYKSSATNRPLNYDDVLFGIEFDNPVDWNAIPVPRWMVKMCYNWLIRLNDDLDINSLFFDNSSEELMKAQSKPEWKKLFCQSPTDRPSILAPIVCAASTMNVFTHSQSNQHHSIHKQHHHRVETMGMFDQHRPVWTAGKTHQFPKELIEFNAHLLAPLNKSQVVWDMSANDRRLYLRGKKTSSNGHPFSFLPGLPASTSAFNYNMGNDQSSSIDVSATRGHIVRSQYELDPTKKYAFEFYADYFDFAAFELRPRITGKDQQIASSLPGGIKSLFSGRMRFEVGSYLRKDEFDRVTGRIRKVARFRIVSRLRGSGRLLWCIVFEQVEY